MPEPLFVATAAGADEVVRRGNRRRARSAAVSAGAALAVCAAVLSLPWSGHPGGRESLVPAQDRVVPAPTSTSSPSSPEREAVAGRPPARPQVGEAGAVPPSRRAATATSAATPPPGRSARARPSSPIQRGSSTIAGGDLCKDDAVDAAQGWCVRYTGPTTARRGHPVTLRAELCRLATAPAGTVTFSSTREVLMGVSGGTADWQAGQGERYTSPGRTVVVEPGSCLTWSSTWDTRGSDGFLVTPGTYDVWAGVDSSGLTSAVGSQIEVRD